jgi:hypothetical protein
MNNLKSIWVEIRRMWFLIILSVAIIIPDDNRWPVIFTLGVLTLTMIVIHLTRKTLFSYIDMKSLMQRAETNAIASGIIFASLIFMMTMLGYAVILFLKP